MTTILSALIFALDLLLIILLDVIIFCVWVRLIGLDWRPLWVIQLDGFTEFVERVVHKLIPYWLFERKGRRIRKGVKLIISLSLLLATRCFLTSAKFDEVLIDSERTSVGRISALERTVDR